MPRLLERHSRWVCSAPSRPPTLLLILNVSSPQILRVLTRCPWNHLTATAPQNRYVCSTSRCPVYRLVSAPWIASSFQCLATTVIHLLQLVWFRMWWLLPTTIFTEVLETTGRSARLWSSRSPWLERPQLIQCVNHHFPSMSSEGCQDRRDCHCAYSFGRGELHHSRTCYNAAGKSLQSARREMV